MSYAVYCIAKTDAQAIGIANRLRTAGFSESDISLLAPIAAGSVIWGIKTPRRRRKGPSLVRAPERCSVVLSAGSWALAPWRFRASAR